LEHVKKILEHSLPSTISVSLTLGDDNAVIMGDLHDIHQAIVNIGLSAQERLTSGGEISITTYLIGEDDAKLLNPKALDMQYVHIIINDNYTVKSN